MKRNRPQTFWRQFGEETFLVNEDDVVVADGIFAKVLYRDFDNPKRLRVARENPPIPLTIAALRKAKSTSLFDLDDLRRILHWDKRTILSRLTADGVPRAWRDQKIIYYFQRDLISWIDKNNITAGRLTAGRPRKEVQKDADKERADGSERRTGRRSAVHQGHNQ